MPYLQYFPPQGSLLLSTRDGHAVGDLAAILVRPVGLAAGTIASLEAIAPDGTVTPLELTVEGPETTFDLPLDQPGTYRLMARSHPSNLLRLDVVNR